MTLHLTKVAFGNPSVENLAERLLLRSVGGVAEITTRYLPKRHAEIVGEEGGSLYWIIRHQLVARSPIVGFGEADGGRVAIRLDPELVLVQARRKRAHQGWRYLEHDAAPPDLGGGGAEGVGAMPPGLQSALAELALV
jgi:hypothetical protein